MNQIEYTKETFVKDYNFIAGLIKSYYIGPIKAKCNACGEEIEIEAGQDKLCGKCKAEVEQGWKEWELEMAKELLEKAGYEVKKAGLTGLAGLAEIVGRISATADKFEGLLKEKEAGK